MLAALLCNLSQPAAQPVQNSGGWEPRRKKRRHPFDRQELEEAYADVLETFEELPVTPAAIVEPFRQKNGRPDFERWAADVAAAQAFIRWHRMLEDETAITLMVLM